jgi:hypothetical protein
MTYKPNYYPGSISIGINKMNYTIKNPYHDGKISFSKVLDIAEHILDKQIHCSQKCNMKPRK